MPKMFSIKKFTEMKARFLLDSTNEGLHSELVDYMSENMKDVTLPLLGNAYLMGAYSKDEVNAITNAVFTCLCETNFLYVSYALNHLSVSENNDGGYNIIFDAVTSKADYRTLLSCIIEDESCTSANWQTKVTDFK